MSESRGRNAGQRGTETPPKTVGARQGLVRAQSSSLLKRTRSVGASDDIRTQKTSTFGQDAVDSISGSVAGSRAISAARGAPQPPPPQPAEPAAPAQIAREQALDASPAETQLDPALDDSALHHEPQRHVDYFSHEWKESDLAESWRYVRSRRLEVANSARLENASWRSWAKAKYNLKTISPETVNWLKDYDVTWLYGPLAHDESEAPTPPPAAKVASSTSVRSILKKKTIAQIMLEDAHDHGTDLGTLEDNATVEYLRHVSYRHAPDTRTGRAQLAFLLNRQYKRQDEKPALHTAASSSSVVSRNSQGERRVHFSDRVDQCIALEPQAEAEAEPVFASDSTDDESDQEDAGLFLGIRRSDSTSSLRQGNCTIAPLPATTLKYQHDKSEEPLQNPTQRSSGFSANYDYTSVYKAQYQIVDPAVKPVAVPETVTDRTSSQDPVIRPAASFGCSTNI